MAVLLQSGFALCWCPFYVALFYICWKCLEYLFGIIPYYNQPACQYVIHNKEVFHVRASQSLPFAVVKINNNIDSAGFKVSIKTKAACFVRGFWNVHIYELANCLRDYQEMKNIVTNSEGCWTACLSSTEPLELVQNEETTVAFIMPSHVKEAALHPDKEKDVYPFVIVFIATCVSEIIVTHAWRVSYKFPNRYIGEISEFVRTKDGKRVDVIRPYNSTFSAVGNEENNLCIICVNESVSIIFMPCKHMSVCKACCKKIDKCPVCRSHIFYYLKIDLSEE